MYVNEELKFRETESTKRFARLTLLQCKLCTVWKCHNLSITQILRENKFGDSRSAKSVILTFLEALNFDFYELLHVLKAEIYQNKEFNIP